MRTHPIHHTWSEGKGRYIFLDLYRGLIVLFMIEGHVVRDLSLPELKSTQWFTIHEIFHGITAPGFLFGSGFALAIATQRKWEQAVTFGKPFLRRLWRAVVLIFIGYVLHVPYLSLQKMLTTATEQEWQAFFSFDVLQCIGFSLIILRLLLFVLRKENQFLSAVVILLLLTVYTTPLLLNVHSNQNIPSALSSALTSKSGSYFPLFPYAGFLFAGTLVSWLFLRFAQVQREVFFIRWLFVAGILLIAGGLLSEYLPYTLYDHHDFWYSSPNYFWIRLGVLFVIMSTLWFIEDSILTRTSAPWATPRWLTTLGMQSLFVYIAHLVILYGWVYNGTFNLRYFWKDSLDLASVSILTLLLTLLMIAGAFGWRYIQKHHPVYHRLLIGYLTFIVVWPLLFSPE
ncbi:MAG: DUF1624 domain-containing protein [Bacteroidetes bacterium]|nr:DUF1624 domain-containing protein [Bacteroidota bacterium]